MDPSNTVTDTTSRPSLRSTTVAALLIMVLQILVALISYPFLPAYVPAHWSLTGEIDSYMPKLLNAILLPAISIGIQY